MPIARIQRRWASLAQATSAPSTSPIAIAASVTAKVIATASSSCPPQPFALKPKVSMSALMPARGVWGLPVLWRNIHLEPFLAEPLDRAIGERSLDRCVEHRLQLGIGPAQAEPLSHAPDRAADLGAGIGEVGILLLGQRPVQIAHIVEGDVDTAIGQVQRAVRRRLIFADFGDILEMLVDEAVERVADLHADRLPLERG